MFYFIVETMGFVCNRFYLFICLFRFFVFGFSGFFFYIHKLIQNISHIITCNMLVFFFKDTVTVGIIGTV